MDVEFKQAQRDAICAIDNLKAMVNLHKLENYMMFDCGVPTTIGEFIKKWDNFTEKPFEEQSKIMEQAEAVCDIVMYYMKRKDQRDIKIEILGGFKCANSSKEALKAGDIITVKEETARIAVESGLAKYIESVVE